MQRKNPLLTTLWTTALLTCAAGTVYAGGDKEGKSKDGYKADKYTELTAEKREKLTELYGRAMTRLCSAPEAEGECSEVAEKEVCPVDELAGVLSRYEQTWEVVQPLMIASFEEKEQREGVLNLLSYSPSKTGKAVASYFFEQEPEAFNEEHLIAFTERAGAQFEEALHARVKKNKAGLRAAACLAMRGDGVGKRQLVKACKKPVIDEQFCDRMVAAAALKRLGIDDPHAKLVAAAHESVLASLDAGRLDEARDLALKSAFFHKHAAYGDNVPVAHLDWTLEQFCSKQAKELETADQVFELIERVSPRL